MNQRSQDVLTANNWNVCQYAVLMHMLAQVCDMKVGELVHVIADAHIYDRHVELVKELITRQQHPAPKFWLNPEIKDFYQFTPDDIKVTDYVTGRRSKTFRWQYSSQEEKIMNIIAAVDKNWAIGKNNELLVRIPMDQKFFRETTTGKVVVMGRKTLESFPNGLPLKNRTNIVLTHNPAYQVKDAIVVHSMEELHRELEKYDTNDVYVIGGQKIYEQLLDECDVAHITKIDYAYDADAYFPNLDEKPEWKITADSEEQTYFDLEFYFYKYERVQK